MLKSLDTGIYQRIVRGAKMGVFVIGGEHGAVVEANLRAAELLGGDRFDFVGKAALDLFPPDLRPPVKDTLADLWDIEGVCGYGCRLMALDGREVPVRLASSVIAHDNEAYLAVFATADEASESAALRRVNDELQKATDAANSNADEARRAGEAKARFVEHLTQELRSPLNGLIGMSALLAEMDLQGDARRTADSVAASARSLLDLVNDVLDYARIEAGRLPLQHHPFRLEDVLHGIVDAYALQAAEQAVSCEVRVDRALSPWLQGDGGRLRQIVVNLVAHAFRHTSDGRLTLAASGGADDEVRIEVTDTGCGIRPEDLAGVFDGYAGEANAGGGPGLGLSISRDLARRMGGRLEVESREGWGTTFVLTLPLPATAEPAPELQARFDQAPAPAPRVRPARRLRVLLAEDNKVNQTVALGMMRKLGHDGTAVDDGRQALLALAGGAYDVVFMDLQMPELGGLEAVRRIRAGEIGERHRNVPIVAMTAHATRQDRQACLEAGMNGYIAKPISSDRIAEALAGLGSPATRVDNRGEPFTATRLVQQMNGDTSLAAEILGVFREDTEDRLARIESALRNYTFEAVVHEARAIEGGALNVCAEIMVNLSRELLRAAERKEHELAHSLVGEMSEEVRTMVI